MNRPTFISPSYGIETDRIIIADASKVSQRDFYDYARSVFCPPPVRNKVNDQAAASTRFIRSAWGRPADEVAELRKAYLAELDAIDARYGEAR